MPQPEPRSSSEDRPPSEAFDTPRKQDPDAKLEGAKGGAQDGSDPEQSLTPGPPPFPDDGLPSQ